MEIVFPSCLLVSTLTIITQITLSHIIRKQISYCINHDLLREALLELVASAELCGTCFELIIVADNFGLHAYAAYLFLMTIWWSRSWDTASACTYNLIEEYVEYSVSPISLIVKVIAQVVGGILSFRWVRYLWLLELTSTHVGRGVFECDADLQVPVIIGFFIECILTCFCRLFSRTLGELEPKYASSIDSLFSTSMVVLAFNYSGGYFNPVLATGLKWGCRGHTNFEHVFVYWMGSIMGSLISLRLWNNPDHKNRMVSGFGLIPSVKKKED